MNKNFPFSLLDILIYVT